MPKFCTYSTHYGDHAEGHLFFDVETGPCTISLFPAAAADQKWMDGMGKMIAQAINDYNSLPYRGKIPTDFQMEVD